MHDSRENSLMRVVSAWSSADI